MTGFLFLYEYRAINSFRKPPGSPPHIPLFFSLLSALMLKRGPELDPHPHPTPPPTPPRSGRGLDTDQSACLSLQVSFGSLMVPWRTSPNSATRGSCPCQTLPQAWTGLTWLMPHGPLKVTSLAEAAGTSCYPPSSSSSSFSSY